MKNIHAQYLHKRGYDPKQLRDLYDIHFSYYNGDFKYRLLIPVYLDGEVVTYIGRDVTDKSPLRYKNLAETKSILPAKECIYNIDNVHKTAIICEGVFDAWRFGVHGVCTFGLTVTAKQINILTKHLSKAFICFDSDPQGIDKANELGANLALTGIDVELISLDVKDPGELTQEQADEIKAAIL